MPNFYSYSSNLFKRSRAIASWTKKVLDLKTTDNDICSPSLAQHFDQNIQGLLNTEIGEPAENGIKITSLPFDGSTRVLQPCGHFILFPPRTLERELAKDGYDADWSPPPPYIYRMWASGFLEWSYENPILTNQFLTQTTKCTNVQHKSSSSRGSSVFVTVEKEISNLNGNCLSESRTLVYLSEKYKYKPQSKPTSRRFSDPDFTIKAHSSAVSLFRFSALTYNSHKIHYDHEYALNEGYRTTLVHGPLTLSLLLNAFSMSHPYAKLVSFKYVATAPLYCGEMIVLNGKKLDSNNGNLKRCELWASNYEGIICMRGTLEYCA